MTRAAALGAALAAVALAIVFALVHVVSSSGPVAVAPARAVTVLTSVAPRPSFFGDRVTARAEVIVDRRVVDPSKIRLDEDFEPFSLTGLPRRSRSDAGEVTSLGYRFVLECLSDDCLPGAKPRAVALPALRVHAPGRVMFARWPAVEIVGRVADSETSAAPTPWRQQLALPPVSFRRSPATLASIFTALASALAAAGFWLAGWELLRFRRGVQERARARTRLQRALDLVRDSLARDVDDRRKALAALARELDGDGRLAFAAERLAWARAEPSVRNVEALVDEVEGALAR